MGREEHGRREGRAFRACLWAIGAGLLLVGSVEGVKVARGQEAGWDQRQDPSGDWEAQPPEEGIDEGDQRPGRDDPDEFYKQPPRERKQLVRLPA